MSLDHTFEIARLETFVLRVPSEPPVRTSFGIMHDRPAVLVRVTGADGVQGWGEVWCNFPAVGAEHRARLVDSCVKPLLLGQSWATPQDCYDSLTERLRILAIQSGEPGPLAQAVAGVDTAIWDMIARREKCPLWQLLGGAPTINVYTSGINPDHPERIAEAKAREGYTAFKLKVGFGDERDESNIRALRQTMGADATLMVDANQAWTLAQAARMAGRLAAYGVAWLEEPLSADTPWPVWRELTDGAPLPIAGGENLRGRETFVEAIEAGGLSVIQPDLGKWGGLSACLPVARDVLRLGRTFCPHWLGGGIGLTASMHLKAAVGGAGYVEVDSNPNALRDWLVPPDYAVKDGKVTLSGEPGLGVTPDLERLRPYIVASHGA
ncbi:mandelate racemase/muconate lactonizing enzyme family protein [Bordetella sp. N]|uniref:mandelate racemase/muconate lactonizing enzyme family protein n=1 Tax=Bordetella sp. N TaxID=1746199 RepID=UPI00070CB080|nr:mandelate racemase/muconate lactonizing enzyme family protein [Bordetella sp. N]ALM86142.1 mandelate racemase [Bordetella sp. N]